MDENLAFAKRIARGCHLIALVKRQSVALHLKAVVEDLDGAALFAASIVGTDAHGHLGNIELAAADGDGLAWSAVPRRALRRDACVVVGIELNDLVGAIAFVAAFEGAVLDRGTLDASELDEMPVVIVLDRHTGDLDARAVHEEEGAVALAPTVLARRRTRATLARGHKGTTVDGDILAAVVAADFLLRAGVIGAVFIQRVDEDAFALRHLLNSRAIRIERDVVVELTRDVDVVGLAIDEVDGDRLVAMIPLLPVGRHFTHAVVERRAIRLATFVAAGADGVGLRVHVRRMSLESGAICRRNAIDPAV